LWLAGILFLLMIGVLLARSVLQEEPAGYSLSDLIRPQPEPESLVSGRVVTVDARDPDGWARLDLSRSFQVPDADVLSWDLGFRRFRIVVNGGRGFRGKAGVVALRERDFEKVSLAPLDGYTASSVSAGGDTINAELEDWYDYGFFSHLLKPRRTVFVLRTSEGEYAKFRILSYYCPGAEPGCLTLEYDYQGDGSRQLGR
jgi:hypothetical protein